MLVVHWWILWGGLFLLWAPQVVDGMQKYRAQRKTRGTGNYPNMKHKWKRNSLGQRLGVGNGTLYLRSKVDNGEASSTRTLPELEDERARLRQLEAEIQNAPDLDQEGPGGTSWSDISNLDSENEDKQALIESHDSNNADTAKRFENGAVANESDSLLGRLIDEENVLGETEDMIQKVITEKRNRKIASMAKARNIKSSNQTSIDEDFAEVRSSDVVGVDRALDELSISILQDCRKLFGMLNNGNGGAPMSSNDHCLQMIGNSIRSNLGEGKDLAEGQEYDRRHGISSSDNATNFEAKKENTTDKDEQTNTESQYEAITKSGVTNVSEILDNTTLQQANNDDVKLLTNLTTSSVNATTDNMTADISENKPLILPILLQFLNSTISASLENSTSLVNATADSMTTDVSENKPLIPVNSTISASLENSTSSVNATADSMTTDVSENKLLIPVNSTIAASLENSTSAINATADNMIADISENKPLIPVNSTISASLENSTSSINAITDNMTADVSENKPLIPVNSTIAASLENSTSSINATTDNMITDISENKPLIPVNSTISASLENSTSLENILENMDLDPKPDTLTKAIAYSLSPPQNFSIPEDSDPTIIEITAASPSNYSEPIPSFIRSEPIVQGMPGALLNKDSTLDLGVERLTSKVSSSFMNQSVVENEGPPIIEISSLPKEKSSIKLAKTSEAQSPVEASRRDDVINKTASDGDLQNTTIGSAADVTNATVNATTVTATPNSEVISTEQNDTVNAINESAPNKDITANSTVKDNVDVVNATAKSTLDVINKTDNINADVKNTTAKSVGDVKNETNNNQFDVTNATSKSNLDVTNATETSPNIANVTSPDPSSFSNITTPKSAAIDASNTTMNSKANTTNSVVRSLSKMINATSDGGSSITKNLTVHAMGSIANATKADFANMTSNINTALMNMTSLTPSSVTNATSGGILDVANAKSEGNLDVANTTTRSNTNVTVIEGKIDDADASLHKNNTADIDDTAETNTTRKRNETIEVKNITMQINSSVVNSTLTSFNLDNVTAKSELTPGNMTSVKTDVANVTSKSSADAVNATNNSILNSTIKVNNDVKNTTSRSNIDAANATILSSDVKNKTINSSSDAKNVTSGVSNVTSGVSNDITNATALSDSGTKNNTILSDIKNTTGALQSANTTTSLTNAKTNNNATNATARSLGEAANLTSINDKGITNNTKDNTMNTTVKNDNEAVNTTASNMLDPKNATTKELTRVIVDDATLKNNTGSLNVTTSSSANARNETNRGIVAVIDAINKDITNATESSAIKQNSTKIQNSTILDAVNATARDIPRAVTNKTAKTNEAALNTTNKKAEEHINATNEKTDDVMKTANAISVNVADMTTKIDADVASMTAKIENDIKNISSNIKHDNRKRFVIAHPFQSKRELKQEYTNKKKSRRRFFSSLRPVLEMRYRKTSISENRNKFRSFKRREVRNIHHSSKKRCKKRALKRKKILKNHRRKKSGESGSKRRLVSNHVPHNRDKNNDKFKTLAQEPHQGNNNKAATNNAQQSKSDASPTTSPKEASAIKEDSNPPHPIASQRSESKTESAKELGTIVPVRGKNKPKVFSFSKSRKQPAITIDDRPTIPPTGINKTKSSVLQLSADAQLIDADHTFGEELDTYPQPVVRDQHTVPYENLSALAKPSKPEPSPEAPTNEENRYPNVPLRRILCFGDSLTKGSYVNGKIYHPYTVKLRELFNDKKGVNYHIINRGLTGECVTKRMRAKLNDDLDSLPKLDLVVIFAGTNDLLKEDCTRSNELFDEIKKLHIAVHKKGYRSVIVTIPQTKAVAKGQILKVPQNEFNDAIEDVNQKLRMYAAAEHVPLCDLADEFNRYTTHGRINVADLWDDNVHPNAKGYDRIGEIVYGDINRFV